MNKNVKKTVSLLLTAGMLLSSAGMGVLAEENTQAPETTAADTTTQAPETTASVASAFEDDAYYNEAAGLLTKMGIFEGYEDGTLKPYSTITRAEMAAVILRVMDIDATSVYAGTFTDVDSSHWAANIIQTAYNAGIINGMGDGTFAPDAPVKFEQAVKMIVCAIGYENLAIGSGGYPTGYITVAARKDIEITKNVAAYTGDDAARGNIIKMIYNAVNALYPTGSKVTASGIEYATDDDVTVGSKLHNVYSVEGILTATNATSIDPKSTVSESQILIDGEIYGIKNIDTAMEDFVGYKIKAYYTEYNNDGDRQIIYVIANKKNDTLVIDASDIEEITNIRTDSAKIEYTYSESSSKTKTAKLTTPTIVYNGKLLTAGDLPSGTSMEDFITPDVGELILNDYDSDGKYDVVFVNAYETFVVTSATDKMITGKYNSTDDELHPNPINVDDEKGDKLVTIIKDGKEVASKNLKKWDVATVQRSANADGDKVINIEICNDTIEGKITDVDIDDDDIKYVTIDGKEYEVDKTLDATGDIKVSKEGKFYLDKFGRIAGMDSITGGKLSGSDQYGWLINVKNSKETGSVNVKLFTQGGEVKTYSVADKLTYWGPEEDDNEKILSFDDEDIDDSFEILSDANDYINATGIGDFQVKLVKYALNSSNEVKKLTLPLLVTADNYKDVDEERVVVYNANMTSAKGLGTVLDQKFSLEDGITEFSVPEKAANVNDTGTYKIATTPASTYIKRDGAGFDYAVAEFDGNTPGVVIRFVGAASEPAGFTYNTADDNSWMMVSKIQKLYDENEDDEVYKITGYANGNKMEYTTDVTTSVAITNDIKGGLDGNNNREYGTTPVWTASSKKDDISAANQANYEDLTDIIKKGDIIGFSTSGATAKIILKMVDGETCADEHAISPWGVYAEYSDTRDAVAAGYIKEIELSDTVMITTEHGEVYSYDAGYYVVTYNASTGKIEDDITASELQEYNPKTKTGDMIVLRMFKGGQREIFAIRFE